MTFKVLSLLFFVFLGVSQRTANKKTVQLDKEFDLRIGQTAILEAVGLTVSFTAVTEDSRCPQGVDCIWAGNADVKIRVSSNQAGSASLELKTELEPKEQRFGLYRVRLVMLRPYPKKDTPIRQRDYVATFVVHKGS